ncbi:hypothetical protein AWC38_SpisGene2972 [Stylophora pistillata]|uniref:Uncharacterized protein n=1 Tax=Stylophora pistillata TaxID=50429 RepID=A0A2B4SQG4_STYPI|nr:hypothetical protein AWC38_SpisGene2972 [Stylophora pistillata]
MGGVKKFDYPKYVWSPTGGWWCNPRNWKRNTAICFAVVLGLQIPVALLSWSRERRYVPPYRHIPSQRFARYAKEDDPSLPDNYQWINWSK